MLPPEPTPLPIQRAFGQRVRALRNQAVLRQEELADRCGLYRTYLSRIENGTANPSLTMIQALADSLGVPITSLFPSSVGNVEPPGKNAVRRSTGSRGRVR